MTMLDPELRELLRRIDDLAPPAPPLPGVAIAPADLRPRRQRLMVVAACMVVLAAVVVVVVATRGNHSTTDQQPTLGDLRTALGTTTWTLTEIDGVPTVAPFTLGVLPTGAIGGRIDCNDYSLDDSNPNDFGRWTMIETAVGCPGDNATLLFPAVKALVNTTSITRDETALTLTGSGHVLVFGHDTSTTLGDLHLVLPALLTRTAEGWASSMEAVSAFYSNVPLGPSCSPGRCGWPISVLPANSIVVAWGTISGPIVTDQPQGMAPNTTVGGRAATKTTDLTEACTSMGGNASVVINFSPDIKMRACMRGPDLAPLQADVEAMLRSVTFG